MDIFSSVYNSNWYFQIPSISKLEIDLCLFRYIEQGEWFKLVKSGQSSQPQGIVRSKRRSNRGGLNRYSKTLNNLQQSSNFPYILNKVIRCFFRRTDIPFIRLIYCCCKGKQWSLNQLSEIKCISRRHMTKSWKNQRTIDLIENVNEING